MRYVLRSRSSSTTPAVILSGEVLLSTGERILIQVGRTGWPSRSLPRCLSTPGPFLNRLWSTGASARILDWHRVFWRLIPEGVFEQPFRGKRVRFGETGSILWLEQTFELQANPLEGFLRVATDSPFQIWINERLVKPITRGKSVFASGPWVIREIARSPLNMAPEAAADRLDSSEAATLLPGQQTETVSGTAEYPVANGEPTARSSASGNSNRAKVSPYADIHNPDRVVPPELTRSRRNVEFQAFSITPLLRSGKNTIRIGLYKDEPEAVGSSRESFFAFDGGDLNCPGINIPPLGAMKALAPSPLRHRMARSS